MFKCFIEILKSIKPFEIFGLIAKIKLVTNLLKKGRDFQISNFITIHFFIIKLFLL